MGGSPWDIQAQSLLVLREAEEREEVCLVGGKHRCGEMKDYSEMVQFLERNFHGGRGEELRGLREMLEVMPEALRGLKTTVKMQM